MVNDYSTQHVLLHAIEEWKVALDKGQHVGVVLMDLSKAFDAIPHGLDYSTQHVLLHAIEEWKVALDNGLHEDVVLIDLNKAFDAIPHGLFLTKLYTYGISKDAYTMIRSYLINRMQRVKLDDVRSSCLT